MACSCTDPTGRNTAGVQSIGEAARTEEEEIERRQVRYAGTRNGSVSIRVRSGAVYHFAGAGASAPVALTDLDYFRRSDDFEVEEQVTAAGAG